MYCPRCGKEIPERSIFCPKCGQRISKDPAEEAASAAPPAVDQLSQAPIISANQEVAGTAYKTPPIGGRNPLYRWAVLGIAVVMILVLLAGSW